MSAWTVSDLAPAVASHAEGTTVRVRVSPRASRTAITGVRGDQVRVQVQAPPVGGAANDALLDHLADVLGVARGAVDLLHGQGARSKVVLVRGAVQAEVLLALRRTSP